MYYTVIKHSGHLRTLEKCRKHSPAARIFYISLMFSNARRFLFHCITRLKLLYLLIAYSSQIRQWWSAGCSGDIFTAKEYIELTFTQAIIYRKAGYTRFYHWAISVSESYNLEFINVPLLLIMLFLG